MGAVLMDLSKAFDTINHDLLIAKLKVYGFGDNALHIVKDYLSDRWERVKINTSFSDWQEVSQGVPQGSVLGPLSRIQKDSKFLPEYDRTIINN